MSEEFLSSLRTIIQQIEPAFRAETQRDVDIVVAAGVRSEADLVSIIEDRERPAALRAIACWFLARLGREKALPSMLHALSDQDPSVRGEVARSLGILGTKQATLTLISMLHNDEDANVRLYAASSLAMLDDSRALEPLIHTLENVAEDPRVRGAAAESLAGFDDPRSVNSLVSALRCESSEVRYWAAFALGELGDPRALESLQRLTSTDDSAEVREEASAAIRAICNAPGEPMG